MPIDRHFISARYREIQQFICSEIAAADGGDQSFLIDEWTRPEGGGGITRILTDGRILEKAGVNFSAVSGQLTPAMRESLKIDGREFFATGISIVMHPRNPFVPVIHMNVRYFELDGERYWFGGGMDLTPHYINKEDACYFHQSLKDICDRFDTDYYPKFKAQADAYFYLPHRAETRGIGGIFYDHLHAEGDPSKEKLFDFSTALAEAFPKIYTHLMHQNFEQPYTDAHKQWQFLRRGRYTEFNLVYDRGTRFGLYSNGRTESILMSLPPQANWAYQHEPAANSPEGQTLEILKKPIDWLGY